MSSMNLKCSIMHHNLPISKENGDINIYLNYLDIIIIHLHVFNE